MFGYEYPKDMPVGRVCLEVSMKPFGLDMSDAGLEKTCRELFDGWRELISHASGVSVLMWLSDGSEILEYNGDMESTFDWARYIGIGNPRKELPTWDPDGEDLHTRPVLYRENPPVITYNDLKRVIATIKRMGRECLGLDVEVGETFDPGPEFAWSDFKFHRHPELNRGSMMASMWIHCAGRLKGDTFRYAAYPNGIPDGTPFGRFLGKQFMSLKRDVGFDYIWLSNGFGFSLHSWSWKGELFDGERFNSTGMNEVRKNIEEFWREFTAETGDMRIETRGSNLSAGMDIAAHGCPVDAIYRYPIVAPPNSPWAALNYRFGLELAGYMSRISNLPKKGYLFRYYPHDPWWHNSPWFDRYDRMPHDIYLPLAIARMDEHGSVTPPAGISFLSADDSYGSMPRRCPVEVTPYLLDAYSHYPDAPGLMTWLYPFSSYVQLGLREGRMADMFMDDWLIENAIDQGLPLNTVVSDDVFLKSGAAPYKRSILVTPVPPAGTPAEEALFVALKAGCRVLLYGSTAITSDRVRALIGVNNAEPIEGELTMSAGALHDDAGEAFPTKLRHVALVSNGGIAEVADRCSVCEYPVTVVNNQGEKRVYASLNNHADAGRLAWIRGSFPHDEHSSNALPTQLDKTLYFPVTSLLRAMAERLGLVVRFITHGVNTDFPVIHYAICENGLYMTGFAKDSTARAVLSTEDGAPLLDARECVLENDCAEYTLPKWWHNSCRFYAKQAARSVVGVMRKTAEHPLIDERFLITGLSDATLTVTPPVSARVRIVANNGRMTAKTNVPVTWSQDGTRVVAEHLTGEVYVSWQSDHTRASLLRTDQLHPEKVTQFRR